MSFCRNPLKREASASSTNRILGERICKRLCTLYALHHIALCLRSSAYRQLPLSPPASECHRMFCISLLVLKLIHSLRADICSISLFRFVYGKWYYCRLYISHRERSLRAPAPFSIHASLRISPPLYSRPSRFCEPFCMETCKRGMFFCEFFKRQTIKKNCRKIV